MRSNVAMWLLSVLCVVLAGSGAAPAAGLTIATDEDGVTSLRVGSESPFHATSNAVTGAHLIELPESANRIATWTETDGGGAVVPHYALGLDGAPLGQGRATSFVLELRHGRFDPLADDPAVEDGLSLDADGSMYIVQFVSQPLQAYRDVLDGLGAEIVGFLPRHAHVVRLPAPVRPRVAALDFVRWIGPYHPAYRLEAVSYTHLTLPTMQ